MQKEQSSNSTPKTKSALLDKYKYLLGQAHAYYKISQDISNLLKKKEPNGRQDKENIIRFDATKN